MEHPSCFLIGAWVSWLTLVFLFVYASVSVCVCVCVCLCFVYLLFSMEWGRVCAWREGKWCGSGEAGDRRTGLGLNGTVCGGKVRRGPINRVIPVNDQYGIRDYLSSTVLTSPASRLYSSHWIVWEMVGCLVCGIPTHPYTYIGTYINSGNGKQKFDLLQQMAWWNFDTKYANWTWEIGPWEWSRTIAAIHEMAMMEIELD